MRITLRLRASAGSAGGSEEDLEDERTSSLPAVQELFHPVPIKHCWEYVPRGLPPDQPGIWPEADWASFPEFVSHGGVVRFGSNLDGCLHQTLRFLAVMDLWLVPFVMSFDALYPLRRSVAVFALDFALCAVYAMGVAARLRTTYVSAHTGLEVVELDELWRKVPAHSTFRADLVALVASPLLYVRGFLWPFGLVRLLRCWRLIHTKNRTMLLEYYRTGDDNTKTMVSLVAMVLFVTHIWACVWFTAKMNSDLGMGREWSAWNGWSPDVFDLEEVDDGAMSLPIYLRANELWPCYFKALRDGIYMLIGWSGPNAISMVQLFTIAILAPLSGCTMSYIWGLFFANMEQTRILDTLAAERRQTMISACSDLRLPLDMQERVLRYHSYLTWRSHSDDAKDLFAELSPNLTTELRLFRMRTAIREAYLFQGMPPRPLLLLVQTCTEHIFSPADFVVRKGESADCMYIVSRGHLTVSVDVAATQIVSHLYDNDCFGELCLLQGRMTRTASIRSEVFSVLWRLESTSFDCVLQGNDHAKFNVCAGILARLGGLDGVDDLRKKFGMGSPEDPAPLPAQLPDDAAARRGRRKSVTENWAEGKVVSLEEQFDGLRNSFDTKRLTQGPTISLTGPLAAALREKGGATPVMQQVMIARSQQKLHADSETAVIGRERRNNGVRGHMRDSNFEVISSNAGFNVSMPESAFGKTKTMPSHMPHFAVSSSRRASLASVTELDLNQRPPSMVKRGTTAVILSAPKPASSFSEEFPVIPQFRRASVASVTELDPDAHHERMASKVKRNSTAVILTTPEAVASFTKESLLQELAKADAAERESPKSPGCGVRELDLSPPPCASRSASATSPESFGLVSAASPESSEVEAEREQQQLEALLATLQERFVAQDQCIRETLGSLSSEMQALRQRYLLADNLDAMSQLEAQGRALSLRLERLKAAALAGRPAEPGGSSRDRSPRPRSAPPPKRRLELDPGGSKSSTPRQ